MPVEDDDDRAAFVDPNEHGVAAFYARPGDAAIGLNVIFDAPARQSQSMDGSVGTVVVHPRALCVAGHLPAGAREDDMLEIPAPHPHAGRYTVKAVVTDSTGLARLELEG